MLMLTTTAAAIDTNDCSRKLDQRLPLRIKVGNQRRQVCPGPEHAVAGRARENDHLAAVLGVDVACPEPTIFTESTKTPRQPRSQGSQRHNGGGREGTGGGQS